MGSKAGKWRNIPTWQVIFLLILFFPVGLYLLWQQDGWSKNTKKTTTWITALVVIGVLILAVIFAPPTVTVTSSLASVKSSSYKLTGNIYPRGSVVTINGVPAQVDGTSFRSNIHLKEGDNMLKIVVISGSKHTAQDFKIHRYTKIEVAAQQEAAAKEKADEAEAKSKASADATKKKADQAAAEQAKKQADAAKQKATATAKSTAPSPAPAPTVTVSQKSALNKAKSYLTYTAFSHDGLVDQLVYEQFSVADATYGADNVGANWNEQAAKKAKDYMNYSSFSRGGLVDQLEYDKFTPDQAAYGVTSVGL